MNSIKLEVKKLASDISKKQKQYDELDEEITVMKKQMLTQQYQQDEESRPFTAKSSKPRIGGDPSSQSLGASPSSGTTPFMMLRRNQQQRDSHSGLSTAQPAKNATQFGPGGNTEDKARIGELNRQVDENNQQILLQKLEIRQLKEQIIRLVESHQSSSIN